MGAHDQGPAALGEPDDDRTVLVLVADDEAPIAQVVAEVIGDMGHRVHVARNGRHALDLARARWPALVVTDLMMPELTGAGLIAALRAEAAAAGRPPPPVILMTAAGSAAAAGSGADAVLPKPFDLAMLEDLVARLLGGPGGGALAGG